MSASDAAVDPDVLATTRRSLHGVAEHVIAGPQKRQFDTIRLLVSPGGFRGLHLPLRVEGTDLVADGVRVPLAGTFRALGAAVGVDPGMPAGVYTDDSGTSLDDEVVVDAAAAALLADCWARGDAALRAFAPDAEVILWPEHFDVGIGVDEVNYGFSPGDAFHAGPYAYVGPWAKREGAFWNAPFGALRPESELPDVDAVLAFFEEGRRLAKA